MTKMTIPADTRPCIWTSRNGTHAFFPHGRKRWHGFQPNRTVWESADTYSARMFVGFNVGRETVYSMEDLVDLVRRVREQQTGDPSSSFVYQRGVYKHGSGEVVEEPGAQVIIINMGASPEGFQREMVELAERICEAMQQEEVVLEIQRNGIVQRVMGISQG